MKVFLRNFVFAAVSAVATVACGDAVFQRHSLANDANVSRCDEVAGDGKGGLIDQGANNLKVLRDGRLAASGVPFEIAAEGEGGKSVIVLNGPLPDTAHKSRKVSLGDVTGGYLYMLHGVAGPKSKDRENVIGTIAIDVDGETAEHELHYGVDIRDWLSNNVGDNAARAWTRYNGSTQVSLFVSKFRMPKAGNAAVTFTANDGAWIIAGVTTGPDAKLASIPPQLDLNRRYDAPTHEGFAFRDDFPGVPPKNIILIIGDGMGKGCQDLASEWCHHRPGELFMQQLRHGGLCTTFSRNSSVTDSAASGTALATGTKVNNSNLGILGDNGPELTSVATLAKRDGKSVAIITSDSLRGATPASNFAHTPNRGDVNKIFADMAGCGFDVLIGNSGSSDWYSQHPDYERKLLDDGYVFIKSNEELAPALAEGRKVVGFYRGGYLEKERAHAEIFQSVIGKFAENDKGFFMMIEGTTPDYGGHGNNPDASVWGVLQVDWVAKAACEFASGRDDTLVVITADHETGGITALRMKGGSDVQPAVHYFTANHTGAPVPLYAYGPKAELFDGVIDNTDVARNFADFFGYELTVAGGK